MKKLLVFLITMASVSLLAQQRDKTEMAINSQLEKWHKAAADADFDAYYDLMTEDAVFIGTDADENWQLDQFKAYAKPYFDKGKAWSFTTLERTIYHPKKSKIAWFDELLDTQMGICRGSGVMRLDGKDWKVQHYVLSIAVPNENVSELTQIKKEHDSLLMAKMRDN
ncbi:SnoaL-like protein [Leeuwenhoekiella aestuarii]|uniref:SnoaL-like protein n=1 Tax=Leeuwenhoekiella aestuarii TaxID=2249426 RepID=A0A4Q0NUS6_9FLAO|nr:nuclear transport factor 2 family protein [Leeuwenhoekiella aestuarii]RXG14353.1 SnoaL-like protein [Leeuwenhoekiella aestuarii]RXG19102.1 SnoaL-like protein [Leeuwenhoekiella aestuarii]